MKKDFNPWPCGPVPEKWQRPECKLVKEKYNVDDMGIIELFEKKISKWAGSKYGVTVSSNTNGIFLCLEYLKHTGLLEEGDIISIPSRTYMSVPMSIINAGLHVRFRYENWSGLYRLIPTRIYDGAGRFRKDMYIPNSLHVLSFQYKKRLPIGRGGMILTDDKDAYEYLLQARFNGRHVDIDQWHDEFEIKGWNMYMTPDDAARGILIFDDLIKNENDFKDYMRYVNYADLSNQKVFK